MGDALVNPDVLKWARERRGLDLAEAAKKIRVSPKKLAAVESGHKHLTFNQLLKVSKVYKRAPIVFYLDHIPEDYSLPDFRSRGNEYSGDLDVVIRDFLTRKQRIESLSRSLGVTFDYSYVGSEQSEDGVLAKMNQLLPYSLEDLRGKRDNEVLKYWRRRLSTHGIMVFQFGGIDREVTRGFLLRDTPYPVIALNKKDSHYARVFTLFHELAHLIRGEEGVCEKESEIRGISDIEVLCNRVAGRYLVPDGYLEECTDFEVPKLSQRFKVSYSVIGIRFGVEIPPQKSKQREGKGGNYYLNFANTWGENFIDLVIRSVKSGMLEESQAMDLTGLTINGYDLVQFLVVCRP